MHHLNVNCINVIMIIPQLFFMHFYVFNNVLHITS